MDFVADLARQMCAVTIDDLPAKTLEHAKMTVASSLAAAVAARSSEPVMIVRRLITERAAPGPASVWFAGMSGLPIVDAARLNHMAADESMADDSALMNGSHLGSAVTAAAFAAAESTGASGAAMLTAVVVGYEAAVRLGRAEAELRAERHAHVSGLNAFGAAVASAYLLGSGPDRTAHAITLAATGAAGIDRVSTTPVRSYQAGTAVAAGIDAALTAHHGYRTTPAVLDRYLDLITFSGERTGRELPDDAELGAGWAIDSELIIKLRPGAFLFGSAVEAAIRVATAYDLTPQTMDRVVVRGHRFAAEDPAARPPGSGSLSYYVASALVRRSFRWDHFSAAAGDADLIAAVRESVVIEPVPAAQAPGAWGWAAEVIVTDRTGTSWRAVVDLPPGAVVAGVDWAVVDDKVHELMIGAGIGTDLIGQFLDQVKDLETAASMNDLARIIK